MRCVRPLFNAGLITTSNIVLPCVRTAVHVSISKIANTTANDHIVTEYVGVCRTSIPVAHPTMKLSRTRFPSLLTVEITLSVTFVLPDFGCRLIWHSIGGCVFDKPSSGHLLSFKSVGISTVLILFFST
jgi:hypothetical protein